MVSWSHQFGPVVRQEIMMGGVWWSKAAHFMLSRKQKAR
jgi:hypothetical protein